MNPNGTFATWQEWWIGAFVCLFCIVCMLCAAWQEDKRDPANDGIEVDVIRRVSND